ncbi:MAG: hypothetical protein SOZ83_03160 [Sphaerochaetaceae bacterium]|nr:hypothetical protein [Sphaerochaetaceae bacterium]
MDDLIENYQEQCEKIHSILRNAIKMFKHRISISYYEPEIIKSGIDKFDGDKNYIDTSSIDGVNNIIKEEIVSYTKRPSRANMQPIGSSVWFAKMKGSNKILILSDKDDDIMQNIILSTGFMGIKASQKLPLSLLSAFVLSDAFTAQRDMNSTGTTMSGINNDLFAKILVPKLTDDEIIIFDDEYNLYIYRLSFLRRQVNQLKFIKQHLLNKYFR